MTHKDFLFEIIDILNYNKIEYMLFAGTLLGAIREQNFLSSDPKDTDIAIHEKDYVKLREVLDNEILKAECNFVYYGIWRKEVTVIDKSHSFKVDIFILEEHEKEYYLYSSKPNAKTNRYNHEWRGKYDKSWFFPLKEIEFLKRTVKIPACAEEILKAHYGEKWTTPDSNWISYKPYNIDVEYEGFTPNGVFEDEIVIRNQKEIEDVTLIVPTYMRDNCLKRLLASVQAYYPKLKVLVGYQGPCSLDTTFSNTQIVMLPEDCGLSYARNALVKEVTTRYTMLLDDDHWIHKTTDIAKMKEVFKANEKIGIVSGRFLENNIVKGYERLFLPCDEVLLLMDWEALNCKGIIEFHRTENVKYGITHIAHNFFIAKTEVLRQYGWDNRHKIHSEHLDFFLNLHINSDVKVAFIPDMIIGHSPVVTQEYKEKRFRQYYHLITEKFGFEKGYAIGEGSYMIYKTNERRPLK